MKAYVCIYTTLRPPAEFDTKSIFKRSTAGFSSLRPVAVIKQEASQLDYLLMMRIHAFLKNICAKVKRKQPRLGIELGSSITISYNDNRYATSASCVRPSALFGLVTEE